MDRLNYHHLLYFFTVAREGSVARASTRLGLAQPTVSAQIHALEDELGRKLLERSGRGLKVTPAGETVLRYAASIFSLGGEMLSALDGDSAIATPLAAGVSASLPQPIAAALLADLLRPGARPRLTIEHGGCDALAAKVASGALQFALTDAAPVDSSSRRLHSRVLLQSSVALYAPPPLARKLSRGFPSRLAGVGVAMHSPCVLREEVDRWLARAKMPAEIVAEMPNPEFYASAAGVAVFAPLLLRHWLRATHALARAGELNGSRWRVFLVTAKESTKLPATESLVAAAKHLR